MTVEHCTCDRAKFGDDYSVRYCDCGGSPVVADVMGWGAAGVRVNPHRGESWKERAATLAARVAELEGALEREKARRKRRNDSLLRDIEQALSGDMRALRLCRDLMIAPPMDVVASEDDTTTRRETEGGDDGR